MADELKKVQVVIGGHPVTFVSDESEDYIIKLAGYVDSKFGEMGMSKTSFSLTGPMKNILAAMKIADDLFKENLALKKELEVTKAKLQEYIDVLGDV